MDRIGIRAFLAVVLGALAGPGCHPRPTAAGSAPPPALLATNAIVSEVDEDDGEVSVELSGSDLRFEFDTARVPGGEQLLAALQELAKSGRTVRLQFRIEESWLDDVDDGNHVVAVLAGVDDAGQRYAGAADADGYRESIARTTRHPAARQLVRGVVLYAADDLAAARAALDAALADARLGRGPQALARRTRGAVLEAQAGAQAGTSMAGDRLLLAALADFRDWARIDSGSAEPRYAIAGALQALGDYDGALNVYEQVRREWLDQDLRVAIRSSAVYRERGELPQALAALDAYGAANGVPAGMPFHYHRGWTLLRLGRYAEAADELSAGLVRQPDYAWALLRRACARAMQGDLQAALADQQQGLELLRAHANPGGSAIDAHNLERATRVLATLRASPVSAAPRAEPGPCAGYLPADGPPRVRSALLADDATGGDS